MNLAGPLNRAAEDAAISIMRRAASRAIEDEAQARLDLWGILYLYYAARSRRGARRYPFDVRILATAAAEVYHHYTDKGPGRANHFYKGQKKEKRKYEQGGLYPLFVQTLANAAGIEFDPKTLPSTCREVQRELNETAALPRLNKIVDADSYDPKRGTTEEERWTAALPARKTSRLGLLKTRVIGFEDAMGDEAEADEGWAVIGGYEPAPAHIRALVAREAAKDK
jgi:hypothetical protein